MKLTGEFIMRQIVDETILVPVGSTALRFNGLITLNPVSSFVWQCLEQGMDRQQILEGILERFEVDRQTARDDLDELLEKLCHAGLLQMEP